jgi:phosphoribosylaminoimidazole-succinocarboxamide synthase
MRDTVSTMSEVLTQTDLPLPLTARGKVRDIYAASNNELLFIATDRLSAFDVVLATGIPDKGRILTQLSLFWFDHLRSLIPNHLVTADVAQFPAALAPYRTQLEGRSMLVKKAAMFPIECVARAYLSGSGWKDYQQTGKICGVSLPAGLQESGRLPEPIFTPAAKNNVGHDENITFAQATNTIGAEAAGKLRDLTLSIFSKASAHAAGKGILLADTKFEFGIIDGQIALCDEVLTPDSSRYWPAATYAPGGPQPSFDKQFVRDYLESIHWNKQPPAPALPADVAAKTREKYLEAFHLLTGRTEL